MPILLALAGLGITGIFGLKALTSKEDTSINNTGDFVDEVFLPVFFFGASIFVLYQATKEKK
jgi:hypothetical protein